MIHYFDNCDDYYDAFSVRLQYLVQLCDNIAYSDDPISISSFHRDTLDEMQMRGHRCATNEQNNQQRTKGMVVMQSNTLITNSEKSETRWLFQLFELK